MHHTDQISKKPKTKMADMKSVVETKLTKEFSPVHLVSATAVSAVINSVNIMIITHLFLP